MIETVQRSPMGRVWHWPRREKWGTCAACSSGSLAENEARRPDEVLPRDRCQGKGCAALWAGWDRRQREQHGTDDRAWVPELVDTDAAVQWLREVAGGQWPTVTATTTAAPVLLALIDELRQDESGR